MAILWPLAVTEELQKRSLITMTTLKYVLLRLSWNVNHAISIGPM